MKLHMNNRGSATITVVVTMLMVMALGSALLFGAYTSYKIALTQRESAKSFYTAENAMDDIRSAVQEQVSDALSIAYTNTLTEYAQSTDPAYDPQAAFADGFCRELRKNAYFDKSNTSNYLPAELGELITVPPDATCTMGVDGRFTASQGSAEEISDNGTLTALALRKVSLRWEQEGYRTELTTDLVISIPAFSGSLGEYAIVAGGGIEQKSGPGRITGTVYSGADIAITGGSLSLDGIAYVADDLVLSAPGSAVSLSGQYYGLGGSTTNASNSSTIIVNGRHSQLNISNLDKLSLAGFSFIDVTNSAGAQFTPSTQVLMGQSMAFKANQLAYLAPAECIENYPSNPFVPLPSEDEENTYVLPKVKNDYVLWDGEKLSDYGETVALFPNTGDGAAAGYVFIRFKDSGSANRYFKKYFEKYPDRVEQYLDFYLQALSTTDTGAEVKTAGNIFSVDEQGKLAVVSATGGAETLARSFSDFVNTAALENMPDALDPLVFTIGGKNAVVTKGSYTAAANDCLIISNGNVQLTSDFTGTVLARGKVTLEKATDGVAVSAASLPAGMRSAASGSYQLSDFLKADYGQQTASSEDVWAAEKLVTFSNWKKN